MTRRRPRRGLISLASIFVLLALFLLLAVVWNASLVTHQKLEAQNAADAGAAAAGLQCARGMNQLVAVQHLTGEMLALVVLIDAVGGPELAGGTPARSRVDPAARAELEAAHEAARTAGANPDADLFRRVLAPGDAGGALGLARARLLGVLAAEYRRAAAGGAAPGAVEASVAEELGRLDAIEETTRTRLVPLRNRLVGTVLPALGSHARRVVEETPARAETAAAEAARAHGCTGRLFPDTSGRGPRLELPVLAQTPDLVATAGGWEQSQAVRAATPWVQFWRKPALTFADRNLPLSGYADFYHTLTNRFTLEVARTLAERDGIHLFVLKDAGGPKGREPWAGRDGSRRADELFGVLAFAHRPATSLGGVVFRNPQPDGIAATAQAMTYNANPQDPDRAPPAPLAPADWQPVVGWDTLNWHADVRVPEYRFGLRRANEDRVVQPTVLPNWRTRLTPVTLLGGAAASAGDDEIGRILRRTDADGWPANTH